MYPPPHMTYMYPPPQLRERDGALPDPEDIPPPRFTNPRRGATGTLLRLYTFKP
jgi:hypothetical protein